MNAAIAHPVFPRTSHTPEVDFRYIDATNRLTGVCDPGNVPDFFKPLAEWAEAFAGNENATALLLFIELQLLSTPSEKHLCKLIAQLGKSRGSGGKDVRVTWRIDRVNNPMLQTAFRIRDRCGNPVWFVIDQVDAPA